MLQQGSMAPDFVLPDQNNQERRLSEYRGKWVILYFYPKDNTPGCTKEACSFRDENAILDSLNAVIIGISKDSVQSHEKFIRKFNLPFNLLIKQSFSYQIGKEKASAKCYNLKLIQPVKCFGLFTNLSTLLFEIFPEVRVTSGALRKAYLAYLPFASDEELGAAEDCIKVLKGKKPTHNAILESYKT